ncbi:DNA phosphorothioation-associated putative methyltransferase [Caenimonas terrae]|uniref:DNA phosphorothioation-associated putative methyltransferase n=1 Tax=Caenimonas terrae TaxID=696074 RepID=A0ABW0N733_9BURK
MADIGKSVGDSLYVHLSARMLVTNEAWRALIEQGLATLQPDARGKVNVAKVSKSTRRLSFLEYSNFDSEPFPVLRAAWTSQDASNSNFAFRSYAQALNPPILHRKELLVAPDHPYRKAWAQITEIAEGLGLFDDTRTIGFRLNWERLIEGRGYRLVGEQFEPLGNVIDTSDGQPSVRAHAEVQRHLTALARTNLSAPVQLLLRHGLITSTIQFFDYGCGKGNDVETLRALGYTSAGWDPHFAPHNSIPPRADVVNLGFVINVIEDAAERVEALSRAFSICSGVMTVGVMLRTSDTLGRPFQDGVLTSRGTFQKYFSQDEIKDYIEQVLSQEVVMAAPGIALVFADKGMEQRFLSDRYRTKAVSERLLLISRREKASIVGPANPKQTKIRKKSRHRPQARTSLERRIVEAQPVLDTLWHIALELGRFPEAAELPPDLSLRPIVPSLSSAIRLLRHGYDQSLLYRARKARIDDLTLYLAMQQFAKRPRYKALEPRLQTDIRCFFGDYSSAITAARSLLTQSSDLSLLLAAAKTSAEEGLGWLDAEHSLQVEADLVDRLPIVMRAFVSCGLLLTGGGHDASVLKIHLSSAKLTLIECGDYHCTPVPSVKRRIKVNLRRLRYDVFEYGDAYPAPNLYWKSRYMHEDSPGYAEQLAFDEALEATGALDDSPFGPPPEVLARHLALRRLEIRGMELLPSSTLPDLDAPCGAHFSFRDFVECGETQQASLIENRPMRSETYNALYGLATQILDPVIEWFGGIKLTYGFCSLSLQRHISHRVAHSIDQHASEETNTSGKLICSRGGAACDFLVENEDMLEVARWMVANTPVDRLYFYGVTRPIHVSWSRTPAAEAFEMLALPSGRRIPKKLRFGDVGQDT